MPKRSFDYAKTVAEIKNIGESLKGKPNVKASTIRDAHVRTVQRCAQELNRPNWLEDWQRSELVSLLIYSANNSHQYSLGMRYVDLYWVPLPGLAHAIFLENAGICAMRSRQLELADRFFATASQYLFQRDWKVTDESRIADLETKLLLRQGQLAALYKNWELAEILLKRGLEFASNYGLKSLDETIRVNLIISALRCGHTEAAMTYADGAPANSPWEAIASSQFWSNTGKPENIRLLPLLQHAKRNPIVHGPRNMTWVLWAIVNAYSALDHHEKCLDWSQKFFRHQARHGIVEPELAEDVRNCRNACELQVIPVS